jgi:hypothetical protein
MSQGGWLMKIREDIKMICQSCEEQLRSCIPYRKYMVDNTYLRLKRFSCDTYSGSGGLMIEFHPVRSPEGSNLTYECMLRQAVDDLHIPSNVPGLLLDSVRWEKNLENDRFSLVFTYYKTDMPKEEINYIHTLVDSIMEGEWCTVLCRSWNRK